MLKLVKTQQASTSKESASKLNDKLEKTKHPLNMFNRFPRMNH